MGDERDRLALTLSADCHNGTVEGLPLDGGRGRADRDVVRPAAGGDGQVGGVGLHLGCSEAQG